MEPIYAEDETRKPTDQSQDDELVSLRTTRILAVNGEAVDTGIITPQRQMLSQGTSRSISPTKPLTGRIPILPRPEPPHRMTTMGPDSRIPIQTGRAPMIAPARGRTVSRSQEVVLPEGHTILQRNSMSPVKTNAPETGIPLLSDGFPRISSPHKVRILRQNPERPPHTVRIIPQSSSRAKALEKEEVLPPHIAATALDLLKEHGTVASTTDPTDQYKNINEDTMRKEIDTIRRSLQTDTLDESAVVRQPRMQSPPMRRLTSPPQGGRQRNTSTSSNSSISGTVRTGALIRHPGSPPLRAPMDGVRGQSAVGTPPMRNGVKSNLKKTVTPQQSEEKPTRRSSRSRKSSTKEGNQNEDKVRCFCGATTDEVKVERWVACDRCRVWQHQYCAGFNEKGKNADYLCEECEDPSNRRKRPSEQQCINFLNANVEEEKEDEEEEDHEEEKREERKHQTRRETAVTTPVRGTVTKNVRSLLTVVGTANNFTGPKMLTSCAKMNVANDHTPGIVAQCSIAPGTAVIEIVANLCIPVDIDKPKSYNPHIFYYDGLVDQKAVLTTAQKQENQICLDGRKFALDGKFVRRCCRPNSTIKHIYASNQASFFVVTRQKINVQDEITIPFEAGFKPTRRDQCRCIPDSGCLLETGTFVGPGFCDLPPVRSPPPASPTRRFVSPPRQPVQQEVDVPEVEVREEKSEEETPVPKSTRRSRTQSTSKKVVATEEVKKEEPKEEEEEEKEIPKEKLIEKKKSPVKKETPKKAPAKKKPGVPKTELDGLLSMQNAVHFDVDFNKKKETRDERKARELYEREQKEAARLAALEKAKNKKKMTTNKTPSTPKTAQKISKKETEQKETPSRRTRSRVEDEPSTSNAVKEEEPEQNERSVSPSKSMSAPKKMFQHRYNQEAATEPEEPVNKRARRTGVKEEETRAALEEKDYDDFYKMINANLEVVEKKKEEDFKLPADIMELVSKIPKSSEPAAKRAKVEAKRKVTKETAPKVAPKKATDVEVKEEKPVSDKPRKKSESKAQVVEEKKTKAQTEVKPAEQEKKPEAEVETVEVQVPEPAPVTERSRRSINFEEYRRRRALEPAEEEPTAPKRKSFMPDFSNIPQTVTLPDLPLGHIDEKKLERDILGIQTSRTASSSARQSFRVSNSSAQPSTSTAESYQPERPERGNVRDRLAQLFSKESLAAPRPSPSDPTDPRVRRTHNNGR